MTDLQPGAELDRMVAEQVMGWGIVHNDVQGTNTKRDMAMIHAGYVYRAHAWQFEPKYDPKRLWYYQWEPWSPSANIAHAWEVVERMVRVGKPIFPFPLRGKWACAIIDCSPPDEPSHGDHWFDESLDGVEYADTPAHAICLAALRAVANNPP